MEKFVFVWSKNGDVPVLPCGSDKILMHVDGRWSRKTIHRRVRETIRERKENFKRMGKIVAGYSVGCLSCRGDDWATCVMDFTPYAGEE